MARIWKCPGLLLGVLLLSCDKPPAPIPPGGAVIADSWSFDVAGEPGPIPSLREVPEPNIQRAKKLHLVSFDFRGTLGELLEEIEKQAGSKFASGEIDLKQTVRVEARSWPVMRVLHQIGVDADKDGVLIPFSPLPGIRYSEGLLLRFSARPWEPDGKRLGWIIESESRVDIHQGNYESTLTWEVGSIEGAAPIAHETCDIHSPHLVYIPNPDPGSIKVKIRGARTWFLDVPIEFRDPKPVNTWKGHGFEISCRWPKIDMRSDRPLPVRLFNQCLSSSDVTFYLPDGRIGNAYDTMGVGGGAGGGGRYSGRFGGKDTVYAWCGCRNAPKRVDRSPPEMSRQLEVDTGGHVRPITDYRTIQMDFRALIHEDFEVVSDELPTK